MKIKFCIGCMDDLIRAYISSMLIIVGITIAFAPQAIMLDTPVIQKKQNPFINKDKCRLSAYSVEFDVIRGTSNIGSATRQLISINEKDEVHLLTSLKASEMFMKFIQKENSIFRRYQQIGFYASEYSKYAKKPFKDAIHDTYTVNDLSTSSDDYSLDPLSVYDHLRELVCSGLRSNVVLNVKEEDDITPYYFEFKGQQALQLPMGDTQTILFVRTRKTSTRQTYIWFAPEHHFVPVKIQQDKDGEVQAILSAKSVNVEQASR